MTSTQATVAMGMMTLRLLVADPSWSELFAALFTFPPLPLGTADDELLDLVDDDDAVDVDLEGVVDVAGTGTGAATVDVVAAAATGAVVVTAGAGAWTEGET
jgi:hypothetical protein